MNILLLYGGNSCEHDISIITAGLSKRHFAGRLYCCYIDTHNGMWLVDSYLPAVAHKTTKHTKKILLLPNSRGITIVTKRRRQFVPIHCAVNCCHGGMGEGGILSSMVELAQLPLVGSNSNACSIAMDKIHTKNVLRGAQLPVVEGVAVTASEFINSSYTDTVEQLGYPVIAKPATLGSSIGIGVAHNADELASVLTVAFGYDSRVLVEKLCANCIEYNCSVMRVDNQINTSSIDVPLGSSEILSFADKYMTSGKMTHRANCQVDEDIANSIQQLSQQVYHLLDMSGVVRIDYIYHNDNLYINEVNTIPGSLAYGLWQSKYSALQFGKALIDQAIADYNRRSSITSSYTSCVLDTARLKGKLGK